MSLKLVAGTVVADRFSLIRLLGEGGMGTVWMAHHTGLDITCAIKFLHAEAAASPEMRARFEREAKTAAKCKSPHIVQILDHGTWQDIPYIAMEYLEGEDLSERLKRLGRLDAQTTVVIVDQVARALMKAHGAGLIHRDLKPANIFLVHDEDREIAKVLDFGIAKRSPSSLNKSDSKTKTGSLLGTPYYMSPEQAQGTKTVDHRSDLWSLAIVVFQCITGQLPMESEALGDLLMKIMIEPLPVPSRVAPVPPAFDAWWFRAAARDPAQRFQSARELVEALAIALGVAATGVMYIGQMRPASDPGHLWRPGSIPDAAITLPLQSHEKAASSSTMPLQATSAPVVSAISATHRIMPASRAVGVGISLLVLLGVISGGIALMLRSSLDGSGSADAAAPAASNPRPELPSTPALSQALPSGPAPTTPVVAPASPLPSSTAPVIVSASPPPATSTTVNAREPKPPPGQGKPGAVPGKSAPKKAPDTSSDFGI